MQVAECFSITIYQAIPLIPNEGDFINFKVIQIGVFQASETVSLKEKFPELLMKR